MNSLTKLAAIVVAGLGFTAGLVLFLLNPNLAKLATLADQTQQKQLELLTLQQQINAYKTAALDLSKASEKQLIAETFVIREDLVKAMQSVEAGAGKSAVQLEAKINEPDVKAKQPTKQVLSEKGKLIEIPYRFSTTSDFIGMVKFLQYLEHLPQFTEISKMDLSAEVVETDGRTSPTGNIYGSIDGIFLIKEK